MPADLEQEQVVSVIMAIVAGVTIVLRFKASHAIAPTPTNTSPG